MPFHSLVRTEETSAGSNDCDAAMAIRSLFTTLRRCRSNPQSLLTLEKTSARLFSSGSMTMDDDDLDEPQESRNNDLKSRIFKLRFPKRSATTAIQKWVEEGNKVTLSELRTLAKDLRKSQRYKHALEILTWMQAQKSFKASAADHAIRLEMIIRVCSLADAENYFENIPDTSSQKAACLPLLQSYVREKATEKAEALMLKLQGLGLTVNPHPFNEMMKLYVSTGQSERVPNVIWQMKQNRIPLNVLSYNLWISACGEVTGVASAEMAYEEMMKDKNVEVGWSTHTTLANIYIRSGLADKAMAALQTAEQKLSTHKRLGYFFLITLYANMNDKDGVLRLWEASKAVPGKITCANFMCMISCLVKIGDVGEAERVFRLWESESRKYDIRVSNILLGAYMRNGWMDKAEALHLHTLEKGGCPNYKTWEILMEGWVKIKEMDKAITAMKKAFAMLKHCDWRPSSTTIMAIAEYFEEQGNFKDAKKYVKVLRRLDLSSLALYKSLLRVHVCARIPAPDIVNMIEKDKIDMDEEACALVQCLSKMNAAED